MQNGDNYLSRKLLGVYVDFFNLMAGVAWCDITRVPGRPIGLHMIYSIK